MSKGMVGVVKVAKSEKTIIVEIERRVPHPVYRKLMRKTKRYKVHVEGESPKVGEMVKIQETRPISKDKHFIVVKEKK